MKKYSLIAALLLLLAAVWVWLWSLRTTDPMTGVDPLPPPPPVAVIQPEPERSAPLSITTEPVTEVRQLGEPVQWEQLDLLPELGWRVLGEFPEDLRDEFPRLEVPVRLLIGINGTVQEIQILEIPHPAFEQPTRAAAAQFVFRPGIVNGVPHPFIVDTYIQFDPMR